MNEVTCPSHEVLADWLGGNLANADRQWVADHVEQCEVCGRALHALEGATAADPRVRGLDTSAAATETADHVASHAQRSAPTDGSHIGGYQVLYTLGEGGMGTVRLARDTRLDRLVALKSPKFTDEHLRRRFVQEAKAVGKLRHPHICAVYDVFEHQGTPYLVLEFIEGRTLDEWLREDRSRREVMEVMAKVARAVGFAHEHQVIHRDLKPSNILIDADNQPHLMDFGLAKILQDDAHDLTLTQQILGTPAYMAPEQARGDNAAVDARTDVYAMGTILYRLLAGRPPFVGDSILRRIQEEMPLALKRLDPSLPRDLETICQKAMAKTPADRYSTAEALAEDLELWLAGEPIRARRIGSIEIAARWVRRRSRAAAVMVSVAVVIVALLGWSVQQSRVMRMRNRIEQTLLETAEVWNQRDQLEAELAQLNDLDAATAAALRTRWLEAVRQDVQRQLRQPRLSPDESAHVEGQIEWLALRSGEAEEALSNTLRLRRSRWTPLRRLAVPFADLAALPASVAQQVKVTAEGLITINGDSPVMLAKLQEDPGDIEVQARFSIPANSVQQSCSLILTWNQQPALRFLVEESSGLCRLTIFQGTNLLRTEEYPAALQRENRTLRVSTESGVYEFEVDKRYRLRFHPLTMSRRQLLEISSLWPRQAALTELRLDRADAPPIPSLLQAGDDLYLQESWEGAREQYTTFLDEAPAGDARVEALFKRGMCNFQLARWSEAGTDLEQVALGNVELFQASALCHAWYAWRQIKAYDRAATMYDGLATSVSPQLISETLSDAQIRRLVDTLMDHSGIQVLFPADEQIVDLERVLAIQRIVDADFRSNSFETRFVVLRMYHSLGRLSEALELGREICASSRPIMQAVTETAWILRDLKRPEEALTLIDSKLAKSLEEGLSGELQLERARVLFALGRLSDAEAEIDAYDARYGDSQRYRMFGAARLMKGVLRRLAGDEAGAQESWNAGRWNASRGDLPSGFDAIHAFALEAVASEGTESQLELIIAIGLGSARGSPQSFSNLLANNLQILVAAVRPAMQSERGRESLIDLAFQRTAFRPWITQPIKLVTHQVMLQSCPGEYLDDDYAVIELAVDRILAYLAGRDPASIAAVGGSIAVAWKGFSPDLALRMVSQDVRPALAFILAIRYRSKGWKDGARLWELAAAAPTGTPVRKRWEQRSAP